MSGETKTCTHCTHIVPGTQCPNCGRIPCEHNQITVSLDCAGCGKPIPASVELYKRAIFAILDTAGMLLRTPEGNQDSNALGRLLEAVEDECRERTDALDEGDESEEIVAEDPDPEQELDDSSEDDDA